MNRTIIKSMGILGRGWIACAVVCVVAAAVPADTLQAKIDTFFVKLSSEFDRIASNSALRSSRASAIDVFFLRELKRNQVINAFARADAKGRLVTELVRMKEPNHVKKIVKEERWFARIAKGAPDYYSVVMDTGRYYLIWSKPVMSNNPKATKPLLGVVMMKIDLWDCFHKLSRSIEEPFFVRLNKKGFYSNKWSKEYRFNEAPLSVRGASMTLRIEKRAAPPPPAALSPATPPPSPSDTTKLAAVLSKADSGFVAKQQAERAKARKILMVAIGAGALLILVLVIKIVAWIKHKMLLRSIDRSI